MVVSGNPLADTQDAVGGWQYPVAVPRYGVQPGWHSAMAQGLALSSTGLADALPRYDTGP
ncbi:D-glucuronyl C5-epimerase family protein [Frankia sp. Cpl3]|uniref:hypothetical protein n=1 Tax=Parafrankia colletiae TaxID=573497 RepID=UPI0010424E18|nr:hypothetical protein [Parafrankia colletiae]MCK9902869.1 D-glucuronyl C5-epimerase family protein [Frankia sp. Cpl3]